MILYLHGFLSTEFSTKGQWVKQAFAKEGVEVITPTYPMASVAKSIELIEQVIADRKAQGNPFKMIMGSSLGGFYGLYFAQKYQWPCVMINPALDPKALMIDNLGDYTHPTTGEFIQLNPAYMDDFTHYYVNRKNLSPTLLLLDKGDDVIPYQIAQKAFKHHGETQVYEGGSHAFDHIEEAWPSILGFYLKFVQAKC
jgi:predicted esterase YcpF (UPF0227 family)